MALKVGMLWCWCPLSAALSLGKKVTSGEVKAVVGGGLMSIPFLHHVRTHASTGAT